MATQTIVAAKEGLFVWVTRSLIATLVYLANDIRNDVKELNAAVPAMQAEIRSIQKQSDKMQDKIYSAILYKPAAKKEEELNIDDLFKHLTK